MNHLDFISNYRMPAPWPRKGWVAIALSFVILLGMGAGITAFAHGGDGPQFDFAIVAYDQSLPDATHEFTRRGFGVKHVEYMERGITCNENGARQAAQNAFALGKVSAYAFSGAYDYSICGESSPCCSLYGVNGVYNGQNYNADNGYIDA